MPYLGGTTIAQVVQHTCSLAGRAEFGEGTPQHPDARPGRHSLDNHHGK